MIDINNRMMTIPYAEKTLGYEGDNAVAVRVFRVTDLSLADYVFKLDVLKSSGIVGIVIPEKDVENDSILLTWTLMANELDAPGALTVQLRAYTESGEEVWHSGKGSFTVGASINATDAFPSPLPSEFAQLEQRVTQAVDLVEEVAEHIGDIATGADGVSVTSALVDENGNLILTLSNGTDINCGHVVGPRGADGLPGADGRPGVDGQPGADAVVDYDRVNTAIASMLSAKLQSVETLPAEPLANVIYFIRE